MSETDCMLGPNSCRRLPAVHFIADDQGAFTGALGMLFDASPLLGGPRSKVSSIYVLFECCRGGEMLTCTVST